MSFDLTSQIRNWIPVGEKTSGSDFAIYTNVARLEDVEVLGFFDSRAKKTDVLNSKVFADLMADEFDLSKQGYIIVTRSHASTTFYTLINFLKNVDYRFQKIWTNVGFVDLTPKKNEVIEDLCLQASSVHKGNRLERVYLEDYQLSVGDIAALYSLNIESQASLFADILSNYSTQFVFMSTHVVSEVVKFERDRPSSFYRQILKTNTLIADVAQELRLKGADAQIYEPPFLSGEVQKTLFDGVHFTMLAHRLIFQNKP